MCFGKKQAIVVRRTYNSVRFPDDYVIGSQSYINKTIERIKADPDTHERDRARRDKLSAAPKMTISEANGSVPFSPDIKIVFAVNFVYETPKWVSDQSCRPSFFGALVLLFLISAVIGVFVVKKTIDKHMIETTCKVFTENGTPRSVKFDGMWIYKLKPDGTFVTPAPFVNPWHLQQDLRQCVYIDTERKI